MRNQSMGEGGGRGNQAIIRGMCQQLPLTKDYISNDMKKGRKSNSKSILLATCFIPHQKFYPVPHFGRKVNQSHVMLQVAGTSKD